jgi:hypothetical protein
MSIRKEKEKEFFANHTSTFLKLGIADPQFVIKTAFFQKGKYGRQVQFFESEIGKGEDIYVEFYDNVNDQSGKLIDIKPFTEDRQLFKYKYNPFYAEELELKEGTTSKGEPYVMYTVPVSELTAVLPDGTEVTHAVYEKIKEKAQLEIPKEQSSLFPDFEKEYVKPKEVDIPSFKVSETVAPVKQVSVDSMDTTLNDITLRDLAAMLFLTPISKNPELNELIIKAKSSL